MNRKQKNEREIKKNGRKLTLLFGPQYQGRKRRRMKIRKKMTKKKNTVPSNLNIKGKKKTLRIMKKSPFRPSVGRMENTRIQEKKRRNQKSKEEK